MKEKKVAPPPWNLGDAQQTGISFHGLLRAPTARVSQGRGVRRPTPPPAAEAVWPSGPLRKSFFPFFFFFFNCTLISCPHNGLTISPCCWSSSVGMRKCNFCVQVCLSSVQLCFTRYIPPESNLYLVSLFVAASKIQKAFRNHFSVWQNLHI